jgi:hypothetical protein
VPDGISFVARDETHVDDLALSTKTLQINARRVLARQEVQDRRAPSLVLEGLGDERPPPSRERRERSERRVHLESIIRDRIVTGE